MPTKTCPPLLKLNQQNKTNHQTLDEEFDVVESDADSISSDDNSENSEVNDKLDTVKELSEKAKEEKKLQERLKKIDSTKVGIKDFFQIALDYEMLGLFCKSIFAYIVCATTLCVFYLIFIYFLNKALWHEYFPIEDLSDVDLNDDIRINDEL